MHAMFAVIAFALTAVGCSKDDAAQEDSQSGKVLSVSVNFSTDKDLSEFADAYVMCYVNGEITAEQISLGKEFKTQVVGTSPADTLGFVVYVCTKPGISDGTYQGKYSLTYTAEMTEDGKLKDSATTNINDRTF